MIGYRVTKAALEASIDALSPGWRGRAANYTVELENGSRTRITNIWSAIKQIYMELQGPKCAFCEKWIEGQAIERDVEHFRPKNRVRQWRVPQRLANEQIHVSQPINGAEKGYRLLAYCPLNYAAACKTCNSVLKRDYFPIAGTRDDQAKDPVSVAAELPYLIFPLGDFDSDPEELIEFCGFTAQPRRGGFERKRALVTIELFKLNHPKRKDLRRARAEQLRYLYLALRVRDVLASTADEIEDAEAIVADCTSSWSPHASCSRCFRHLWETNRAEAEDVYSRIREFLGKGSA